MRKTAISALSLILAGALSAGLALAQDAPTAPASIAAPEPAPEPGLLLPAVQKAREAPRRPPTAQPTPAPKVVTSEEHKPQPLLLPAIQKVREAAAQPAPTAQEGRQ